MEQHQVIVVGGGIGGSAAALRAAQHGLTVAWISGDPETARASRAHYVFNVDNMIGVSGGIVQRRVLDLLSGPEHAAAREAVARTHFHIGIPEIVEDVTLRLSADFSDRATLVLEKAIAARREGHGFAVETDRGRTFCGGAVILSTGVMDRQPSVKLTTKSGKVVDDIRWIYPWANAESLLYCILCEGHLVRGTRVAVFGASEAAAQVALLLHERYGVSVTLLGNGEALQASVETRRLLDAYEVAYREARLVEILDGEAGRKGESLRGFRFEDGTEVEARFGMVAMGLHRVYNDLARRLGAELDAADGPDDVRHVLVDDATSETSVRGLFAVGDMSRHRGGTPSLKQIYTAQEYAVRAIQAIDRRERAARRARVLEGR
jgi:thioredoxin reductase (NADPH)